MGVMGGNCCGLARYQTVITLGIGLIVADAALFMINIGNTWTQELRAPMVQSMRAIGPRDPDLVVNALVDYPVIWNWLLTANLFALAFDTFLVISTFLRRERLLRVYLVLSVTNIVHTIAIVLPTLFINFFGGAIAKFIDDQEAILDASNADSKKRRPFDGLVIDWNLIHIFAIVASITMVFVNIYATWVVNNFRKELYKGSGQGEDVETIARLRAEMLEQERQVALERQEYRDRLPVLQERDRY